MSRLILKQIVGSLMIVSLLFFYLLSFFHDYQRPHFDIANINESAEPLKTYETACRRYNTKQAEKCQRWLYDKFQPNSTASTPWPDVRAENVFNRSWKTQSSPDYRRILLLVYYNLPQYNSAAKVWSLYHRIFGRIVFCTPNITSPAFWPLYVNSSYLKIPLDTLVVNYSRPSHGEGGQTSYGCFDAALEALGRDAFREFDGIVMSGDDVMLNYWTWADKPLNKVWAMIPDQRTVFSVDTAFACDRWSNLCDIKEDVWYYAKYYQAESQTFYDQLESLGYSMHGNQEFWSRFLNRLVIATGGRRRLVSGGGDLLYVPKHYWSDFRAVLRLFMDNQVWLEIAMGSAVAGLVPSYDLVKFDLRGFDSWQGFRHLPIVESYSPHYDFLHPFKMSRLFVQYYGEAFDHYFDENSNASELASDNYGRHLQDDATMPCVYCYLLALAERYAQINV